MCRLLQLFISQSCPGIAPNVPLQDLESKIQDSSARSSAVVRRLQAEHQETLLKLQAQISELEDMQLRSDAARSDAVQEAAQQKTGQLEKHMHSDEENKHLQDRILVLEAANVALENALLHGFDDRMSAGTASRPMPTRPNARTRVSLDGEADNVGNTSSCPTTPRVRCF